MSRLLLLGDPRKLRGVWPDDILVIERSWAPCGPVFSIWPIAVRAEARAPGDDYAQSGSSNILVTLHAAEARAITSSVPQSGSKRARAAIHAAA